MTMLSTLRKSGRAAAMALALGAVSFTAMPVAPAAAQALTFKFGIQGGGGNFSFGVDRQGKRFRRACLTNNEIRSGLRREGYNDIRFRDRQGRRVQVTAERGRWEYRLRIDRCTGGVDVLDRDRRGRRGHGFGLHFRF